MLRLISSDPMRNRARGWRVWRALRDWPAGVPLASLPAMATDLGFARAASPAQALSRLRAVLDRLACEGRLKWAAHAWGGQREWMVVLRDPARTLVSAGAPAHWGNVK